MNNILPNLKQSIANSADSKIFCELTRALDKDITVGEFIERHIKNFNFTFSLDESMYEHELCHLAIGLAALKTGHNPIPSQHAYNGNWHSENIAVAIQMLDLSSLIEYQQDIAPDFDSFFENAYLTENFDQVARRHKATTQAAWALANASAEPTTLFEMHHRYQFETNQIIKDAQHLAKPEDGQTTQYGEAYHRYERPDKKEMHIFYNAMIAPINTIREHLKLSGITDLRDASDRRRKATECMKAMKIRDLFAAIPDTPQTIYKIPNSAIPSSHITCC